MCLISPTQKFKLEKSTLNTKEWGKSKFDEILELWIFYFGLFCSAAVLYNSSELGFDFFAFARYKCLTKRLEEKSFDSYSSYVRLFGFYTLQNFVFTSKTDMVSLAWFWCYGRSYLFQKYSSLHPRSLNNICTIAIPGEILASWCSWRAVELSHRLHSPHNPKPKPAHFNNSTTRRPRSEKPLQTLGSRTFVSFFCFSIANQEAVSRSAALALQKRPLFFLFALVGRTVAILDVALLCAVEGAQCKPREFP